MEHRLVGRLVAGSLLALGAVLPAWAQQDVPQPMTRGSQSPAGSAMAALGQRWYLAPMFSYTVADSGRSTDDGYGATLAFGKRLSYGLMLELTGFYSRFSQDAPGDNDAAESYGGGIAALVSPLRSFRDLYGIAAVHYGETRGLPGAVPDYESAVFDAGLGYLLQVSDAGSAVRLEARYRMDVHDEELAGEGGSDEFHDALFSLGLILPLGGNDAPTVESNVDEAAVVPVSAADDDNDGVANETDQCPGTPAGAVVNEAGCENDEDVDGAVDRLDRCPGTPAGTQVNEEGCLVQAAPAACRTPEPGLPMIQGCAAGQTVVLQGASFEFDRARPADNATLILDGAGDALMTPRAA